MVARARHVLTQPNTPEQVAQRGAFSKLKARWREGLTSSQREGWQAYASRAMGTGESGPPRELTGEQAFVKANAMRVQLPGIGTLIEDPPTIAAQPHATILTFQIIPFLDVWFMSYDPTDEWCFEKKGALIGWCTGPVNASVQTRRKPYRFRAHVQGGPGGAPPGFVAGNADELYRVGHAGWLRCAVLRADGRYGQVFERRVVAV